MITENADCDLCTKNLDCPLVSSTRCFCADYTPKKLTNADRIRAMSDEELLDVMLKEICILTGNEHYDGDFCFDCKDCLWEWLKQKAET